MMHNLAKMSSDQTRQTKQDRAEEGGLEDHASTGKWSRLEGRMAELEKQNTRLTEALVKIMGLELQAGHLVTTRGVKRIESAT